MSGLTEFVAEPTATVYGAEHHITPTNSTVFLSRCNMGILPIGSFDLKRMDFDGSATVVSVKEVNENVGLRESWIAYSLTLFSGSRLFTKIEQAQFEEHKRRKFKKVKFEF